MGVVSVTLGLQPPPAFVFLGDATEYLEDVFHQGVDPLERLEADINCKTVGVVLIKIVGGTTDSFGSAGSFLIFGVVTVVNVLRCIGSDGPALDAVGKTSTVGNVVFYVESSSVLQMLVLLVALEPGEWAGEYRRSLWAGDQRWYDRVGLAWPSSYVIFIDDGSKTNLYLPALVGNDKEGDENSGYWRALSK
eukprot:CAMPEP_0197269596 /NCGR_PEP_ID=MMETSP1432-20130617/5697_1 /TAXON_ID=44447 /ORGANISM="Pseudo-nitzschia delicatissima, Strain UNC1205" /LENGTH=191 /DNA_ID=CAMNT_0042734781 /DNA_START=438 /DNA_END=1014 /DNA_ORIENTATION=-